MHLAFVLFAVPATTSVRASSAAAVSVLRTPTTATTSTTTTAAPLTVGTSINVARHWCQKSKAAIHMVIVMLAMVMADKQKASFGPDANVDNPDPGGRNRGNRSNMLTHSDTKGK